jgi:hypothetical protein
MLVGGEFPLLQLRKEEPHLSRQAPPLSLSVGLTFGAKVFPLMSF